MLVVTGPTGNVGTEVARLLVERGDKSPLPFRIAAHNPGRVRERLGQEAQAAHMVACDYDDRSTWGPVLEDVGVLFLVFPTPTPKAVDGRMKPLIDAAVEAGCRHIVYLSVPGADRNKVVPHYGVERHIEASGAGYTFLRASYFMQNLCRGISTHGVDIADHGEVFIPAGRGRVTFVDSRDVAAVALEVFENPAAHENKAYTLTGPERLDFAEVADVLSRVLGYPVRYTSPPMARFWYRLWRRGVPVDVIGFMTIVYVLTRTGRNEPLTGELPELLGRPATDFERFAEDNEWRWRTKTWT